MFPTMATQAPGMCELIYKCLKTQIFCSLYWCINLFLGLKFKERKERKKETIFSSWNTLILFCPEDLQASSYFFSSISVIFLLVCRFSCFWYLISLRIDNSSTGGKLNKGLYKNWIRNCSQPTHPLIKEKS